MVGALVLISIFVLAVAIIAVVFFSQPAPLKLPAVAVSITNHSKIIEISHNSGDSILMSEFAVLVDDQPISYTCTDCGDSWSIGEVLTIDYSTHADFPNKVDILYKGTGARQQLLTTRYLGTMTPTPTPFGPPTTSTTAVTPTVTPTPPVSIPVASFFMNVTSGAPSLAVQFIDTSTNTPTTWAWAFGDGATSTVQNPSHVYTATGTFTVNLTAQNSAGSSSATRTITVSRNPVIANFTGSPTTGFAPLTVQFTDASTGPITVRNWTFGDGNVSSEQNPLYTYPSMGVYSVGLTVSNGTGSNTLTRTDYITVSTPVSGNIVLNAYKGAYIESGGAMQFRVTGLYSYVTVNGVTYTLNQGDTVRLVIENNGYGSLYSSSSAITTFSFSDVSFYQNGVYKNRGTTSGIQVSGYDQYQSTMDLYMPSASAWTSFSVDGTSLINGQSSATVRITGLKGAMNLEATSGNVYYTGGASGYQIPGPQVTGITPNSGVSYSTVSITDLSGMYFEPGLTPTVKLRNGVSTITATGVSVLSSSQIQCTFNLAGAAPGQWDVVVVNADGRSGTGTGLFTVTPAPLAAGFTYTYPSSNAVQFTDTSTGTPTAWNWNFGDGTANSSAQNPPAHIYTSAGTYTVTLTVTNGGGSSSVQQPVMATLPASHTTILNAAKAAFIESGGAMQFRVTGLYSSVTVNGVTYPLSPGDTVRLVMESNGFGTLYSSSSMITTFSFSDVSLYQNGIYRNRGTVSGIQISGYDQYQSTMNLYMPPASAWTSFSVDGISLINGQSSAAVRITGIGGAMNLQAISSNVYYTGGTSGYTIT